MVRKNSEHLQHNIKAFIRKGEDLSNSDIDIAVIGRKEKEINLNHYEKELERKIHINFYNSFKHIHKNLKENICNGILIAGSVEL